MKLKKVVIKNFRSVRERIEVDIDPRVTAFLGSNDHGKTNILEAIRFLNDDPKMTAEDVNWNVPPADLGTQPEISFHFRLTDDEQDRLDGLPQPPQTPNSAAITPTERREWLRDGCVVFARRGYSGALHIEGLPDSTPANQPAASLLRSMRPRVEPFLPPQEKLPDSIGAANFANPETEFMRGILVLAGVDIGEQTTYEGGKALCVQTDTTVKMLEKATEALNQKLSEMWSQGNVQNLRFRLQHLNGQIELYVDDPNVPSRKVRLSRRSAGVTQFFRMAMVLEARRAQQAGKSFIYIFDEPGTYLHPRGQRDLLPVFEQFSEKYQVLYATHSIFLINHNFPERHRLVRMPGNTGTIIESKASGNNWLRTMEAMGVSMPPTTFFCDRFLLVEGDSDVLFILELFRQLATLGKNSADINFLGIHSIGEASGIRYWFNNCTAGPGRPRRIGMLSDGDKAGASLQNVFNSCIADLPNEEKARQRALQLDSGRSTEDTCLYPGMLVDAAVETAKLALGGELPQEKEKEFREKLNHEKPNETWGTRFKRAAKAVFKEELSKSTLARTYCVNCRAITAEAAAASSQPDKSRVDAAVKLIREIIDVLDLPERKAAFDVLEPPATN